MLITGCAELLTLGGSVPRRRQELSELGLLRDGALIVRDGLIAAVGPRKAIERHSLLRPRRRTRDGGRAQGVAELDLGGRVVLPGFVDSHTHLVSAAPRTEDYERRIRGEGYQQMARRGGGILSSVRRLRAATPETLAERALRWLGQFAQHGTTTIEAKSGYGLDANSEIKTLRLHRALSARQPINIVSTFLGAHVVAPEFARRKNGADVYMEFLARRLLPRIAREGLAEFCDVFVDRGAFTVRQARRLLTAARACGLGLRLHAEQLTHTGATRLAVELGAASADHLEQVRSAEISALARSHTVATLLPGCDFHLGRAKYAPARKLIAAGAIVALATDFNPGTSPTVSMPMILSLATTQLGMSPAEAIAAATINAAYALRRQESIGSLEVGKYADLAAYDVADYREIPYYFGMDLCALTMKRGRVIWSRISDAQNC
jgi:imidazolonepropionase